jgi:hypothetical protein
MLFVAPLVALLLPQIDFLTAGGESRRTRWAVPVGAAIVAVSLLVWGNATSGFDADHPRPDRIAWVLDANSGDARWVSLDRHLDTWTAQFFPSGVERREYDSALLGTVSAYIADAPSASVAPPEIAVVSDTTDGDVRTLGLRLSSPEGARIMVTSVDVPGEVVALTVDGRPVDLQGRAWARDGSFQVQYRNVPSEGWDLTISARVSQPIVIGVEEIRDGLPAALEAQVQPRPAEMMPAPGYARDPTTVTKTFRFE